MFKQQGGFWLYFVGIIIMFLLLFWIAQVLTGRSGGIGTKKSPSVTRSVSQTSAVKISKTPVSQAGSNYLDISKDYYAEIITNKGVLKVDLFERSAPNTVGNFINLVNSGYYSNTKFYKLIPGVALQGGSKDNTPSGSPGYTIPDEINWDSLDYEEDLRLILRSEGYKSAKRIASVDIGKYVLAMANPGPNKAGSQFIIILGDKDNAQVVNFRGRSTVFGKVIEGTNVVDSINLIPVDTTGAYPKPQDDIIISEIKIYIK